MGISLIQNLSCKLKITVNETSMSLKGTEFYIDCTFTLTGLLSVCMSEAINEFYMFAIQFVID